MTKKNDCNVEIHRFQNKKLQLKDQRFNISEIQAVIALTN